MAKRKRTWPPVGVGLGAGIMDNHTHLPLAEGQIPKADGYRMPLATQLELADQVGVQQIITVGCEMPDWRPTLELAAQWPQVRVALGIHPNEAALHEGVVERSPDGFDHELKSHHVPLVDALAGLEQHLGDPLVVAVGETGMDFFRTAQAGRAAQEASFAAHLELARQFSLPLQIHDRDSHRATVEVLRDSAAEDQPIVFHSFSADRELADLIAANGWFASFSGMLTYPANEELRAALLRVPRDRVLVETDAPYLTPVPFRGMPNASYVLPNTVRQIAELWDEAEEATAQILLDNSRRLYGSW